MAPGVQNFQPWGSDGSVHATITVAAGSPGAVFSVAAAPIARAPIAMRTHADRRHSYRLPDPAGVPITEPQPTDRPNSALHAARRPVDFRAVDRLLAL
jgi:hypothetical protein